MPFSSDEDTIDFIYGVINWKSTDASLTAADQQSVAGVSMSWSKRRNMTR